MVAILITILGLIVFEVVSGIDNAVANAYVVKTLPQKYKRFFLTWGLFFAVVVIRGLLPFIIIWISNPSLSVVQIFTLAFSNNPEMADFVTKTKPLLLLGGGTYLFLTSLSWLFTERKKYAFLVEHFIHHQSVWFYSITLLFITGVVYFSVKSNPYLALAATIGATAFFVSDGFKKNAEQQEEKLKSRKMSSLSKILYLEVLDAAFSVDGVIGAFAFTVSVPLILIGNGIGALIIREITVRGNALITKFAYLKNGAMYSIGVLGYIMVLESFGHEYPFWFVPVNTFTILFIFLYLSYIEIKEKRALDNKLKRETGAA